MYGNGDGDGSKLCGDGWRCEQGFAGTDGDGINYRPRAALYYRIGTAWIGVHFSVSQLLNDKLNDDDDDNDDNEVVTVKNNKTDRHNNTL